MIESAIARTRAVLARAGVTVPEATSATDLAALVAESAATCADRDVAKALRRELYLLRQHGVAVPEATPRPDPRPLLGTAIEGFVSSVDGQGDRLVWLLRERSDGTLLLIAADLNEPAGLLALHRFEISRKRVRAMRERLLREGHIRLVPADWRALDALVLEGVDRLAAPVDRRLDYRRLRSDLTNVAPIAPQELTSPRTGDADSDPAAIAASETLLAEPELRTWWPRRERLDAHVDAILALRAGPIVLTEAQSEMQLAAILDRATRELFPAAVTARRLQAVAYVLAETGRIEAARRALGVADLLRRHPDGAGDVPLLRTLVHRPLGALLATDQARTRDDRRDALVLTPGELAARTTGRSPSHRPRLRG